MGEFYRRLLAPFLRGDSARENEERVEGSCEILLRLLGTRYLLFREGCECECECECEVNGGWKSRESASEVCAFTGSDSTKADMEETMI